MIRRTAFGALAAAVTLALTGCTLATTLAEGGASKPTEPPAITISDTGTPDPTPTATDDGIVEFVEQTDIQVPIGQAATIEGRAGNPVGTFQVDSVTTDFTACTDDEYVPLETGQYVEIVLTVTATDALAAEDGSYDYPNDFALFLANIVAPDGSRVPDDLGYECMGIRDWVPDVRAGESVTGPIYLLIREDIGNSFSIEWDYGHQNFLVPHNL